jgi:hypothetical protein
VLFAPKAASDSRVGARKDAGETTEKAACLLPLFINEMDQKTMLDFRPKLGLIQCHSGQCGMALN